MKKLLGIVVLGLIWSNVSIAQITEDQINYGIKQVWEFAHPNNQKNTGPLNRFISMIKGDNYKILLNHKDHEIKELKITDYAVFYEVIVLDQNKIYYKFNWQVEKHKNDGPLKDCWLTTIVSAPIPLSSSI